MDLAACDYGGELPALARIAELVVAEEKSAPKFIVSGGIQRSAQALQRLSDVLGYPVYPNEEMEASIRGAAVYALDQLGTRPRRAAAAKANQAAGELCETLCRAA
jgi:sugar (pentulose or hexulose) kinase